jgi:hypothetical protein
VAELLLRNIPNNYRLKNDYLQKRSDSLSVLILGSSHTLYGINPIYMREKSFNAAYITQTLDLDWEILKKYKDHWKDLKVIVLPISYFSLTYQLNRGIEDWRVKSYILYWGIGSSTRLENHFELLNNTVRVNCDRIIAYYLKGKDEVSCNSLGWGTDYNSLKKEDLTATGIATAKRHTRQDSAAVSANLDVLKKIVDFSSQRNIHVLFFTPPAYKTYVENLEKKQLDQIIQTATKLAGENRNVTYVNLMNNPDFVAQDYFDADHMNEIGAKKLTLKIDSLINRIN